jgi:hypothetical protein
MPTLTAPYPNTHLTGAWAGFARPSPPPPPGETRALRFFSLGSPLGVASFVEYYDLFCFVYVCLYLFMFIINVFNLLCVELQTIALALIIQTDCESTSFECFTVHTNYYRCNQLQNTNTTRINTVIQHTSGV